MRINETEELILKDLKGAEGEDLIIKIASIIAAQEQKIQELTLRLQNMKTYEKHFGALSSRGENAESGQNVLSGSKI